MIKIFLTILLSFNIYADINITKEWLKTKPRSYYKDFYIWRYLDQNISPNDAIWALGEAKRVNNKLLYKYAKKLKNKETSRVIQCMKMPLTKLKNEDPTCIKLGLTPYKATKLSSNALKTIINNVDEKYPKLAQSYKIINSPIPFQMLQNSSSEIFYDTFLEVGGKFRANNFNYHFPKQTLKKLQSDKKNFKRLIRKIVIEPKLTKPQESLLNLDGRNLDHKSTFFLAMNAIKHKKNKKALEYLELSGKNAYFKFDKDKVDFWKYLLTKDKSILSNLATSWDINIYSLYAKEHFAQTFENVVFDVQSDIKNDSNNTTYDINDPFAWLEVLKKSKKVDDKKLQEFQSLFNTKETSGHLAFIKERYNKYKIGYFPSPFKKYIKKYTLKRQTLINAIARQESRFIPTSISSSYAMGVMQIMPFLSKALAKQLKEPYNIDQQLEASTNIKYANKHLDWLEKKLKHPLLIAYAYNGGIGFTKRMLKSGIFKKGRYEPYLSMELVPYDESKKYGKKVLANYVMYYNHTHKNKISVTNMLQNLETPFLN